MTFIVAAGVASCAIPTLQPGEPRVVDRLVIAPYAMHEQCARMMIGDRLDYRYQSSASLDFDIRYREDNAVLSPVVREQSTADSGTFEARTPERYCLVWQAGAPGAIIGYRVLLRPYRPLEDR
ncbi:MAG: hypothetical protein M3R40_11665 [Pseudomonadota bacterium]|nr:hypothetical protein [Pseudomonadota bacterium]